MWHQLWGGQQTLTSWFPQIHSPPSSVKSTFTKSVFTRFELCPYCGLTSEVRVIRGNALLENWAQTLRGKKSSSIGPLGKVQSFYTQSLYLGRCWGPVTATEEAGRLQGLQRAAQKECFEGDFRLFLVLPTLSRSPCLEQQPALEQLPVTISELVGGSGF